MAHGTRISGANKAVTAGLTRISGVNRKITKGLTLMDGVQRDIEFSTGVVITFETGSYSASGYNDLHIEIDGIIYNRGTTIEVPVGTTILLNPTASGYFSVNIFVNGTKVGESSNTSPYRYTVNGNVTITPHVSMGGVFGEYRIVEE